jgi:HD-GYP domain-containing protein (c-di-GMP phosphodiesterase class II)
MYVAELDRPWEETPFPIQGFCIKSKAEIDLLRKLCRKVSIDRRHQPSLRPHDRSTGVLNLHPGDITHDEKMPLPRRVVEYKDAHSEEAEFEVAVEVRDNLSTRFRDLFRPFKSAKDLRVEEMAEPITAMVESIIRNPNALARLSLLKGRDSYTYNHCINMGIQAVIFGRYLGLARQDLDALIFCDLRCDHQRSSLRPRDFTP